MITTTIARANTGDWLLDNNNRLIQIINGYAHNDLGQPINYPEQRDFIKVDEPPSIKEHSEYEISIIQGSSLSSRHPCIMPKYVQLTDFNYYGRRKRYEIFDSSVSIPFFFATIDPRVPNDFAIWSIRSRKFFDLFKNQTATCHFTYDIGSIPYLHINFPNGKWIKVPKQ